MRISWGQGRTEESLALHADALELLLRDLCSFWDKIQSVALARPDIGASGLDDLLADTVSGISGAGDLVRAGDAV